MKLTRWQMGKFNWHWLWVRRWDNWNAFYGRLIIQHQENDKFFKNDSERTRTETSGVRNRSLLLLEVAIQFLLLKGYRLMGTLGLDLHSEGETLLMSQLLIGFEFIHLHSDRSIISRL